MPARVDLTGLVFGRLRVVSAAPSRKGRSFYDCVCACGNTHRTAADSLRGGVCTSCGCAYKDAARLKGKVLAKRAADRRAREKAYRDAQKAREAKPEPPKTWATAEAAAIDLASLWT